jgi:hypothetical protein
MIVVVVIVIIDVIEQIKLINTDGTHLFILSKTISYGFFHVRFFLFKFSLEVLTIKCTVYKFTKQAMNLYGINIFF